MMKNLIDKNLINKNIVYTFVLLILLSGYGILGFIVPQVKQINEKKSQIAKVQAEVQTLQSKAQPEQSSTIDASSLPVSIYESPYKGMDLENASVDLVDELIQILKLTKNRVSEISFTSSTSGTTGVLTLNMSLNGNYMSLQNFLQKVFIWKYLAGIKDISIEQQGDPENLTAKLTLDLYINN